jgi:hypothetical protein
MHYPSIVGANGRIAPENISLNGGWKPIDVNEPVGVSIHQDLGRVLVSTMPGHSWMIESDLRDGTFALDGEPIDGGHSVRVEVGIAPAEAVRSVTRWWRLVSEPLGVSPKLGRAFYGIPEPEGSLNDPDDEPEDFIFDDPDYEQIIPKCVLIHIFPPIQEVNNIEADKQEEHKRKLIEDRMQLKDAHFLGHKADRDTDGKFAYGQTRLPDGMLGDRKKAIQIAQAIQGIAAKAKHRE